MTDTTKAERATTAARELGNSINEMSFDIETFASAITRLEHRTVQQAMFRTFWAVIKQWAEDYDNNNYDARNEATCKACSTIVATVGDDLYFPSI